MPRRKPKVRKTPQPQPRPRNFADSFVLRYDHVQISESSFRHGISEFDIRHAQNHAIRIFEFFDELDRQRMLMIGPDQSGNLLELLMAINPDTSLKIFHAMRLRPKFEGLINDQE